MASNSRLNMFNVNIALIYALLAIKTRLKGFYLPPVFLLRSQNRLCKVHFLVAYCYVIQILPNESDKILLHKQFSEECSIK